MATTSGFPSSIQDIRQSDFFQENWYYSVELVPGLFTPGANHRNIGLTRHLLRSCEVEGRRCLDIGTMEAAVPVLLSRRRAAHVVAVDRFHCLDRIQAVKHYTGADFEYYSGLTHQRTAPFLVERGLNNFDLVVLSGVLYHCWGPMDVLAMARSLVRTGGVLVVETLAALDDESAMFFNRTGRFSPDPSTFFLPTVSLLEYVLRHFQLGPLDCVSGPPAKVGDHLTARVAIACRALNEVPAGDDAWMREAGSMVEYLSQLDWTRMDRSGGDPPGFEPSPSRVLDESTGTCDVVATLRGKEPLPLPERVAKIGLSDLY